MNSVEELAMKQTNALFQAIHEETKKATTLEEIALIRRIIKRAEELVNSKEAA
jgi:hypothetical protein